MQLSALRWATGEAAHGGGRHLERDSAAIGAFGGRLAETARQRAVHDAEAGAFDRAANPHAVTNN